MPSRKSIAQNIQELLSLKFKKKHLKIARKHNITSKRYQHLHFIYITLCWYTNYQVAAYLNYISRIFCLRRILCIKINTYIDSHSQRTKTIYILESTTCLYMFFCWK